MSLIITEPIKTVNSILTKAIAARSQLLYGVQREDWIVADVIDFSGFARVRLDPLNTDNTSQFTIGQQVYMRTNNGAYNGIGTITNVFLSSHTFLDLDTPFTAVGGIGYLNNLSEKIGYRIEVQLLDDVDALLFITEFRYVPNQSGFVSIDVGELMTFYMTAPATFTFAKEYKLLMTEDWNGQTNPSEFFIYDNVSAALGGATLFLQVFAGDVTAQFVAGSIIEVTGAEYSGRFEVVESDLFSGVTRVEINTAFTIDSNGTAGPLSQETTLLQAVLAQKQLLKQGGANMWEFLIRQTGVASDNSLGQLLTRFENPKTWEGWNRTVSFILDQEYLTRTGHNSVRGWYFQLDINHTPLTTANFIDAGSVDLTPRVQIYQIPATPNTPGFAFFGVYISINDGIPVLTQQLDYQLQDECPQPVMLDWINTKGGVDQWLFEGTQEVTYDVGEGILAERPITTDIEFLTRTKQRFPGARAQRMTLRAEHLLRDQLIALQEIKQTNSLRVYLSKDGTSFIDAVVVNTFTTIMSSEDRLHKFTVTVEFPDEFDFFEGKLY